MRTYTLVILAFISFMTISAKQRTINSIIDIANKQYNSINRLRSSNNISSQIKNNIIPASKILTGYDSLFQDFKNPLRSSERNNYGEAFYFVNYKDKGFVLISGDDNMPQILGYSEEGQIYKGNIPENLKDILIRYVAEYKQAEKGNLYFGKISASVETNNFPEEITPLLKDIQWNQESPFNKYCPIFNGIQTLAGCSASSASQIMYYYKYPGTGQESITYRSPVYGTYTGDFKIVNDSIEIKADFSKYKINWDEMIPSYTYGYTEQQINAAAELSTYTGYAFYNEYGIIVTSSYMQNIMYGLEKFFNYDDDMTMQYGDIYSGAQWTKIIKNEIYSGRPVLSGNQNSYGGHAYIIDGYDKNNLFHINWGWNGIFNGYFLLYNQNPYYTYNGYGFNLSQCILTKIKPSDGKKAQTKNIVYNLNGIKINKIRIKQQDSISIDLYKLAYSKLCNKTTIYGLLYKDNYVYDTLCYSVKTETPPYTDEFNFRINKKINHKIDPGKYQLKFAYRTTNQIDTIIYNKAFVHSYKLTATNDSLFFYPEENKNPFNVIKADTLNKTFNKNFNNFKLSIENKSNRSELIQTKISLESVKRDSVNKLKADTTISILVEKLHVPAYDTANFVLSPYINIPIQEYYLSVKYLDENNIYKEILLNHDTINIKVNNSGDIIRDLIVRKPVFDTTINKNRGDSVPATFTIINKGDYFEGYINMLFTDFTTNNDSAVCYGEYVQLYKNDSTTISYNYPIRKDNSAYGSRNTYLPSGKYNINLSYFVKLKGLAYAAGRIFIFHIKYQRPCRNRKSCRRK